MTNHYQQQEQQSQQNMQMGSGLTRYRSAPSSYFATFLNNPTSDFGFGGDDISQFFNPRASSPETQRIFDRFMNNTDAIQANCSQNITLQSQSQLNSQFLPPRKNEVKAEQPQQQLRRQQSNDYSSVSQMMYQSEAENSAMGSSYNRLLGSVNANRGGAPVKMEEGGGRGGGGNSSLTRHSSSPAGLFANIIVQSGDRQFDHEDRGNDGDDIPGFPLNSWDDSAILSDDFLKGLVENDDKMFSKANASDDHQNNEGGNRSTTLLSHHLSLPKNSSKLSTMEKLLQDSVPCKIRAKRGCATHPRSIAERVRRTKISERMRKLQELVPNMEKQTNTADMLDLAVEYIKDLQTQVKTLSDNRAKCSCSAKKKS